LNVEIQIVSSGWQAADSSPQDAAEFDADDENEECIGPEAYSRRCSEAQTGVIRRPRRR
jgi:hypothetical protein